MSDFDRILVMGDTHGDFVWIGTVLRIARDLGITCAFQLGDFGIWPGREGRVFLDQVQKRAEQASVTLYAMTGNHDDQEQIAGFEARCDPDGFVTLGTNLRWAPRGHRWTWNGVGFGALGGAFSVDWRRRVHGASWWRIAEEVRAEDVTHLGSARLDVLFTHDAPDGAEPVGWEPSLGPTDESQSQVSRVRIREAVEATRPRLVVHGHWHVCHTRALHIAGGIERVRVEGLASDQEHDGSAWGILCLPSLVFTDGRETEGVARPRAASEKPGGPQASVPGGSVGEHGS